MDGLHLKTAFAVFSAGVALYPVPRAPLTALAARPRLGN